MGGQEIILGYMGFYMCLGGGCVFSTIDIIFGGGCIGACTLGYLAGIVIYFYGGLSVLSRVCSRVGTGFTLDSGTVCFVGSDR